MIVLVHYLSDISEKADHVKFKESWLDFTLGIRYTPHIDVGKAGSYTSWLL